MASENETVASIADCIRHLADNLPNGVILNIAQCNFTADRLEAAHRREIAELRECLKEAVTEVCNRLEKCGFKEPCVFKTCYVQKWRKALRDEGGAK